MEQLQRAATAGSGWVTTPSFQQGNHHHHWTAESGEGILRSGAREGPPPPLRINTAGSRLMNSAAMPSTQHDTHNSFSYNTTDTQRLAERFDHVPPNTEFDPLPPKREEEHHGSGSAGAAGPSPPLPPPLRSLPGTASAGDDYVLHGRSILGVSPGQSAHVPPNASHKVLYPHEQAHFSFSSSSTMELMHNPPAEGGQPTSSSTATMSMKFPTERPPTLQGDARPRGGLKEGWSEVIEEIHSPPQRKREEEVDNPVRPTAAAMEGHNAQRFQQLPNRSFDGTGEEEQNSRQPSVERRRNNVRHRTALLGTSPTPKINQRRDPQPTASKTSLQIHRRPQAAPSSSPSLTSCDSAFESSASDSCNDDEKTPEQQKRGESEEEDDDELLSAAHARAVSALTNVDCAIETQQDDIAAAARLIQHLEGGPIGMPPPLDGAGVGGLGGGESDDEMAIDANTFLVNNEYRRERILKEQGVLRDDGLAAPPPVHAKMKHLASTTQPFLGQVHLYWCSPVTDPAPLSAVFPSLTLDGSTSISSNDFLSWSDRIVAVVTQASADGNAKPSPTRTGFGDQQHHGNVLKVLDACSVIEDISGAVMMPPPMSSSTATRLMLRAQQRQLAKSNNETPQRGGGTTSAASGVDDIHVLSPPMSPGMIHQAVDCWRDFCDLDKERQQKKKQNAPSSGRTSGDGQVPVFSQCPLRRTMADAVDQLTGVTDSSAQPKRTTRTSPRGRMFGSPPSTSKRADASLNPSNRSKNLSTKEAAEIVKQMLPLLYAEQADVVPHFLLKAVKPVKIPLPATEEHGGATSSAAVPKNKRGVDADKDSRLFPEDDTKLGAAAFVAECELLPAPIPSAFGSDDEGTASLEKKFPAVQDDDEEVEAVSSRVRAAEVRPLELLRDQGVAKHDSPLSRQLPRVFPPTAPHQTAHSLASFPQNVEGASSGGTINAHGIRPNGQVAMGMPEGGPQPPPEGSTEHHDPYHRDDSRDRRRGGSTGWGDGVGGPAARKRATRVLDARQQRSDVATLEQQWENDKSQHQQRRLPASEHGRQDAAKNVSREDATVRGTTTTPQQTRDGTTETQSIHAAQWGAGSSRRRATNTGQPSVKRSSTPALSATRATALFERLATQSTASSKNRARATSPNSDERVKPRTTTPRDSTSATSRKAAHNSKNATATSPSGDAKGSVFVMTPINNEAADPSKVTLSKTMDALSPQQAGGSDKPLATSILAQVTSMPRWDASYL